jgi:transcriptional regulator with XRE-family HTH domain
LGRWIRRRRKALDLTQAELAGRVGCSAELLRKIEADARRPSRQIAVRLAEQLQLAPQECDVFVRAARAELAPDNLAAPIDSIPRPSLVRQGDPPADKPAHNLPAPLITLIGRERELAALAGLIHQGARIITLTGPGGVGKTRLALELAARLAASAASVFPDGLWLVELAALHDPALVAAAVARGVGAAEGANQTIEESLRSFLRARRALLLLDNLEHLLEATPLVGDLLRAAPGLVVLATSRAPLGLPGEHVWALEPLSRAAAIELFATRAPTLRSCRPTGRWQQRSPNAWTGCRWRSSSPRRA